MASPPQIGFSDSTFLILPFQSPIRGTREAWLADYVSMGATWVRIDLPWSSVEPTSGATLQWDLFDQVIDLVISYGLKVCAIVERPPAWATRSDLPFDSAWGPPTSPAAFAEFARKVADRYGNKLSAIEVWNEPNLARFWWPTPDAAAYTAMLKLTYTAIRTANPTIPIISAGLSPAGSVAFLSSMYTNGAKNYMTAVGFHPYSFPSTPSQYDPASGWSMLESTTPSVRSVMTANSDDSKQVWFTEYGAPTGGDYAVTEAVQATSFLEAINYVESKSWVGPIFIYEYQDTGVDAHDIDQHFGLYNATHTAKPAYASVKLGVSMTSPLPHVAVGDQHVAAHNAERDAINALIAQLAGSGTVVTPPTIVAPSRMTGSGNEIVKGSATGVTTLDLLKTDLANLTIGDLLVVNVAFQNAASGGTAPYYTKPSQFTRLGPDPLSTTRVSGMFAYPIPDAAALAALPATMTFGTTAGSGRVVMHAYRVTNARLTSIPDRAGSWGISTTSLAVPDITTDEDKCLILGHGMFGTSSPNPLVTDIGIVGLAGESHTFSSQPTSGTASSTGLITFSAQVATPKTITGVTITPNTATGSFYGYMVAIAPKTS